MAQGFRIVVPDSQCDFIRLRFDRDDVSTDNVIRRGCKNITNSFKGWPNGLSEKGCLDGVIGWVKVHMDDVFD